jgi:hypothetical protein
MHLVTESPGCRRAGILALMYAWIGQRQRELSDRVHAAGDERARQHGWEVTKSTDRFGFGTRSYRDPRSATLLSRPRPGRHRHEHGVWIDAHSEDRVHSEARSRTTG